MTTSQSILSDRGPCIEIDRIDRRLPAHVEAIALWAAEADIGDHYSDRDRAEMRAVRRQAEHVAARRGPDIAMDVAAEAVEQSFRTGRKQGRRFQRLAVDGIGPDRR